MKEPKAVVVLPDLQVPFHSVRSLKAVLKYVSNHKWDELIQIGDLMDFNAISTHDREDARGLEGLRLKEHYKITNKVLDDICKAARNKNKKTKITVIQGNHDYRIERYINENPVIEGMIEPEKRLHLEGRGIKFVKFWEKGHVHKIGNATFIHGLYTNDHHAKKTVNAFGTNVFYGHTHDVQTYSQVLRGKDKTIVGQSLGCLCEYEQHYMKGKPTRWQKAFGIFYFFPDGHFTYYVPRIFNHRFACPSKRIYKG